MNKDKSYYLNLLKKFSNYSFLEELFALNLVLSIFGMGYALLEALFDSEYGNGLFLIAIPIIVCIFSLPQIIGRVLVSINKKRNSRIILVFMFIASIFSVGVIFSFYSGFNKGIFFFVNMICSVILTIILLLKLIFEKKNGPTIMCCKKCHNNLKQGATFCSNCGTKVEI